MSASLNRRGLLGFLAVAPIAAAADGAIPSWPALARLRPGFAGGRYAGAATRLAVERAAPFKAEIPASLARLSAGVESDVGSVPARMAVEARTIAALAATFPAEFAAHRSFGAPMLRRLYAAQLAREAAQLTPQAEPPPTPPAPPGPGA